MKRGIALSGLVTATLAAGAAASLGADRADSARGPSTATDPYVIPTAPGVLTKSLLSVDDDGAASDGYELAGIPDDLGAMRGRGSSFTLFMNHELREAQGSVRRHGQRGAFVSTFSIDPKTGAVEAGSDTIDPGVRYWNYVTQTYQATGSPAGQNPRNPADTPSSPNPTPSVGSARAL